MALERCSLVDDKKRSHVSRDVFMVNRVGLEGDISASARRLQLRRRLGSSLMWISAISPGDAQARTATRNSGDP